MKWDSVRKWLYGLIYAVIGGSANAVVLAAVDQHSQHDPALLWKVFVASAVVSGALYLKQSPLPPDD